MKGIQGRKPNDKSVFDNNITSENTNGNTGSNEETGMKFVDQMIAQNKSMEVQGFPTQNHYSRIRRVNNNVTSVS
jgi:hypothetical protein